MVPLLLICCDCGGAPGGGAGFEPVPECSDGAIHSWAVEGPQPQLMVSASVRKGLWWSPEPSLVRMKPDVVITSSACHSLLWASQWGRWRGVRDASKLGGSNQGRLSE